MLPSEIPKDKRVKYSGVIKNDRHYAKNAPLWTAQVLRIRHAFFYYFDLFDKSIGSISRIDDDEEDEQDFGTNNDEETAQEREKREEPERDLARVLERV